VCVFACVRICVFACLRVCVSNNLEQMDWPPSQGQRPWPTINTPPWHSSRHTSPRITICSPTPQHSNPRSIQANPPSRLPAHPPESLLLDDNTFVDHCPCFTTCKSHCITTYHNTPCFVNAARTCLASVCLLALLCPCAFFGCDLLACMGHLIFFFSVRAHFSCLTTCMFVGADVRVGRCVCVCVQNSTPYIHHTICPLPHCRRARDSFAGATVMNSYQRTPMASPASHVESKYDLHPHPMHAHPTHLQEIILSCCPGSTESTPACIYIYLYDYAYLCAYMHIFVCMYVRISTCRCL